MNYSEEFKSKVREAYGSQYDKMLSSGDEFLGRYLDDGSNGEVNIDTILLATSLEKLQAQARKLKIKKELFSDWSKQFRMERFPNEPDQWF